MVGRGYYKCKKNCWNGTIHWVRQLAGNLQPLATLFKIIQGFFIKSIYPIRVGEHSNLAFGLRLAYDYAETTNDDSLKNSIAEAAMRFYSKDANCPLQ